MKRRAYLVLNGIFLGTSVLGAAACAPTQLMVVTPLDAPLGDSVLSVQTTSKKSILGPLSPNKRYAERMQIQFKNRLIGSGFVLKEKTADLHLHLEIDLITTGAGNNQAECRVDVKGYREWPGDLVEMKEKQQVTSLPAVLELSVDVVKKRLPQGYSRELLAEEAAKDAVELVVDYLLKARV